MKTSIEYVITIPGRPAPKGSLKCIGRRGQRAHVLIEDNEHTAPWRSTVAGWLTKRGPSAAPLPGQPLGVECTLTLDRPKHHYGTGRNAGTVKPRYADAYPVGHNTGDLDKLVRLILDAMQDADVLPDDSQVCELVTRKAFTQPELDALDRLPYPGVRLRLYALT